MTAPPLLSFIVLSYNYEGYIGRTLRSILAQTVQDFEIVVVDDASTDASCAVIAGFADPRIRLLVNQRNIGGAASYNRAVSEARGEWLVNVDADDWIAPDKSAAQLALLATDTNVDIVGTHVTVVDADGKPHPQRDILEGYVNHDADLNRAGTWIGRNALCRSSTMVRRAAHLRIGLDDPAMVRAPDYELWTRALRHGCRFAVLPKRLTCYRMHARGVTFGDSRGTFLELSHAMLRNLVPLVEAGEAWQDFARVLDWVAENKALPELAAEERSRLMGSMLLRKGAADYPSFLARVQAREDADPTTVCGRSCLEALRNHPLHGVVEELERDRLSYASARDWWQEQASRWEAAKDRLQADLAEMAEDHRRDVARLTTALTAAEVRQRADAAALAEQRVRVAAAEAELAEARALMSGLAWKFAMAAREAALRHPTMARQARRMALLTWWTLRGEVVTRLRAALAHRKQLRQGQPVAVLPGPEQQPAATMLQDPEPPEIDNPWPADRPLVSVVIPCFNYGHFVQEAIESVLAQTFRDLEIIVVEGGSTSLESRQLLLAASQRAEVRLLVQAEAQRVGANRNFGIDAARGRYVCCLDADDKLHPTYIEKAVFLLERCGYDLVSSALRFFGNRDELVPILPRPTLSDMLQGNHVVTTAVFRRRFWEKAGGYQDAPIEEHGHVHEDWRFWVRLSALGARFINLPRDPMLLYRSHGPSLSGTAVPMDAQRELVRRFNADVLDPASVAQALSEESAQRHRVPLSHLTRGIPPARQPSLLLALPFMILGGAERLLSALVGHLVVSGWRVTIVTTLSAGPEHGDTMEWFERHTKEVYRLPGSLPEEHWEEFLHYLILTRRTDILWIAGSAFVYQRLPMLKQAFPGLRVADLLFNPVGHTENNRRYRRWIDLNFVENQEVRQWLLADGESPGRICLVRSGVDIQRLRPVEHDAELRLAIGAAPGDVVVGFSGRWSEDKNPLGFIEIARRVAPGLPVRFVMTGAGHLAPMIERAIAAAKFPPGRFHLLGEVEDIQPWLNTYDVLALPSQLDGRPVVVMEAMAVGLPVLASRIGALPEMIEEATTGWLCDPHDIGGFVSHVERVARDPSLLTPMRRAARAFAEAHFDERVMHALYESRLRALIAASCGAADAVPPGGDDIETRGA